MNEFEPGQEITVPYPFVHEKYARWDGFKDTVIMSWRPGIAFEPVSPDDFEPIANAMGKMLLTVVSVHKPGRYPERVFFTRKFEGPDGKQFGKGRLHIMTTGAFRRRARGYMHDFRLTPAPPPGQPK